MMKGILIITVIFVILNILSAFIFWLIGDMLWKKFLNNASMLCILALGMLFVNFIITKLVALLARVLS
jgi:hypothetical protein